MPQNAHLVNIIFRQATLEDLPSIVAMLADDKLGKSREDFSIPLNQQYLDAFTAIQSDSNQFLEVAISDNQLAGCLQLSFIPGLSRLGMWRGQIESVRVATEFRGQGIGRKLFEWAITECRNHGCGLVQLTSDKNRPEAIDFYQSLGFEASHEGMKLKL